MVGFGVERRGEKGWMRKEEGEMLLGKQCGLIGAVAGMCTTGQQREVESANINETNSTVFEIKENH